ncbi:MAG: hypothetical protein ACI808_003103 [Paraglaciecola sp.]
MKKKPGKLPIIVALSLGLHFLLLYTLVQSHSFKATNEDKIPIDRSLPIQARLVFTPIMSPNESRKETEILTTVVKKEIIPPLEEQVESSEMPAPKADEETATTPPVKAIPTQQPVQKTPSAIVYGNAPDMARQQLSGLNKTKLQELAQQAAREYQQQKNSPELNLKRVDPFVTEDQKLRDKVQVRVNCSGNTNKVAIVLSGFMGGTLKCSKGPNIDSFIQNRLNKTALLPAKENK